MAISTAVTIHFISKWVSTTEFHGNQDPTVLVYTRPNRKERVVASTRVVCDQETSKLENREWAGHVLVLHQKSEVLKK